MERKEWKTIISRTQLDELVSRGILYKNSEDCYNLIIDSDRWGAFCMPSDMVSDVAGKTLEFTKVDSNRTGWRITQKNGVWFVGPWMLEENYAELIKHGKYRTEPYSVSPEGFGLYKLKIMDFLHLEQLVNKGIISKKVINGTVCYHPDIDGVGDISMPVRMAERICGKIISCKGTCSSWIDLETGFMYAIAPWMLADNYDYLLDRLNGIPNAASLEDDEDEEEEEEESPDYSEARAVGTITAANSEYITLECADIPVPVLCYGNAEGHGKDDHVKVRGKFRRVHNMMGYPELDIVHIEEF